MKTITPQFVDELIDFAPTEETRGMGFAENQREGTVAIYNMLARNHCAYLADEVGMGKTYIALAVMSIFRYLDPHARIVVIAPRENIQLKWVKELRNFIRLNWQIVGNRVKSLQGGPAWEPVVCNSLIDFAHEATAHQDRDFYLRMTSFSLALKQVESRRRQRKRLLEQIPWIDKSVLSKRTSEGFRRGFGCALNAAVPHADLVIVDEAHNLKHGFSETGSTRNHIMALAFGHDAGQDDEFPWYGRKAQNILFLSATPFEDDYAAIQRQFSIFGFGNAPLRSLDGGSSMRMNVLADPDVSQARKRDLVGRLMIRRVSSVKINGKPHTKNMYRREWRNGGYHLHDEPMQIDDPKQRLVVALMQKKVAEILQDERFNNSFQIGMLSSFESFLESVGTTVSKPPQDELPEGFEEDGTRSVFHGDQADDPRERKGIDTGAVLHVSQSYRDRFNHSLPHPKLDSTAEALRGAFDTGEKTLIFARRIATVDELAAKIDLYFDEWIRRRMDTELPDLTDEIARLFQRYERERRRRPEDILEEMPSDAGDAEVSEASERREFVDDGDEGSAETFFAWFFRGKGPSGVLSGAAFQKNRLGSTSSVYSTLFEDDHVAWLLGRPDDPLAAMARQVGRPHESVVQELRSRAWPLFRGRSRQKEGYPRLYVFEAYQAAALGILESASDERLGERARVVREQRHPGQFAEPADEVPTGFPGPEDSIGATNIITELVKRPGIRARIWPKQEAGDENLDDFRGRFRRREQRREAS